MSPAALGGAIIGVLFLAAVGIALFWDWQKAKEIEIARRARAYDERADMLKHARKQKV